MPGDIAQPRPGRAVKTVGNISKIRTPGLLCLALSGGWPGAAGPVWAATLSSDNLAGGATELAASGAVTVSGAVLGLTKQVYDTAGTCLAGSPADAACGGGVSAVSVNAGTRLKFLIFVKNTSDLTLSDVRFQDVLDESATGFSYITGSMRVDGSQADSATAAALFAAADGGSAQSDALGGPDDFASKVGATITVGAVSGQANQTVSLPPHSSYALLFEADKK